MDIPISKKKGLDALVVLKSVAITCASRGSTLCGGAEERKNGVAELKYEMKKSGILKLFLSAPLRGSSDRRKPALCLP
ncbi:MAG: hypothetical protein DSM106950_28335 [Stigonema ocellatum SAG 48.90 = DSM 106950]|nr:hypothetical protein [Stigonema ocellatum SAG 48.90 = DSM 106950]